MSHLEISLKHSVGHLRLSLAFETSAHLLALSGPSGSGKTTLINMISGLIKPDSGMIRINGTKVFDSEEKINIPAHKRRIGYVFQDGRLFPHLNVRSNLVFGRWFTSREPAIEFQTVVKFLGLESLLSRGVAQLSGGERQRVAIGRAILAAPELLMMDEPLAALDQDRKNDILPYIERIRDNIKIPIIYVSHSNNEIKFLSDEIITIKNGKIDNIYLNNRNKNNLLKI